MKYFAYGSNMDVKQMQKRGIAFSKREFAILKDWELKFNKIASRNHNHREGYANIMKKDNSIVEGIVYTLHDSDLEKLDTYEGVPEHYKKITVKVLLEDNEYVEAIIYIANEGKINEGLKPDKDYIQHLLNGCDLLSTEYCQKLKEWELLD